MKKVSILALFVFCHFFLNAQVPYRVTIENGCYFPFASGKQTTNSNYNYVSNSAGYLNSASTTLGSFSGGNGNITNLMGGFTLSNGIGAEIGCGYLFGIPFENKSVYSNRYDYPPYPEIRMSEEVMKMSVNSLRIIGGISFNRSIGSHIELSFRTGLNTGVLNKMMIEDKYHETYEHQSFFSGFDTTEVTDDLRNIEYSKGFAWGVYTTFATGWKFNNGICLGLQYNFLMQNWGPSYGKLTKFDHNSVDQLPSLSTQEKEAEFYDELTTTSSSSSTSDPNKPYQGMKEYFSMNSMGFMIHCSYTFGKKGEITSQ